VREAPRGHRGGERACGVHAHAADGGFEGDVEADERARGRQGANAAR
jgi:hypothetical protein